MAKKLDSSKMFRVVAGTLLSVVLLFLMLTSSASAFTSMLPGTAYGLTTAGQPDPNWSVSLITSGPYYVDWGSPAVNPAIGFVNGEPAQVLTPGAANWGSEWLPGNGPYSSWIGVTAGYVSNGYGPFEYQATFNLSGFNLSTVRITGLWTIDDSGYLLVNGHQVGFLPNSSWFYLWPFTITDTGAMTGWLNQGLNTLQIITAYTDDAIEGVRLEGTVTSSAVPVPAALLLFAPGLAGLAAVRRRLKK
jgi:hypothetical protein